MPPVATPIAPGSTFVNLASTVAPNFQGYMIATCNFPYAHGFAFISDFGARNLAMGYLAQVVCSDRLSDGHGRGAMSGRPHHRLAVLVVAALLCAAGPLRAENIDPGQQYAWGENVGWINFKPSQGPGVTVTISAVKGFAWAENIGWINLSPMDGGVMNDGHGHLSGFAWGENVGWINFAPTGAGVTIDESGKFVGFAWGENIGWVNFNVASGVRTSFRPTRGAPTVGASGMVLFLLALALIGIHSLRRSAHLRSR